MLPDAIIERGTPYPFLEFQGRNRLLALLTDLYDGDMTAFLERGQDGPRVYSNYFRRVSTAMADLMCIAPPTITGMVVTEEFTAEFQEAIYDAVVNATTYGQAGLFLLDGADYSLSTRSSRHNFILWTAVVHFWSHSTRRQTHAMECPMALPSL